MVYLSTHIHNFWDNHTHTQLYVVLSVFYIIFHKNWIKHSKSGTQLIVDFKSEKMEVVPIPEFVNRELLERAIKSYEKDETIDLENFNISAAFAEHFGSEMFRAKLFYKSAKFRTGAAKTLAVVIKVKPLSDSRSEQVVAGGPLFETEIEMYENYGLLEEIFAIFLFLALSLLRYEKVLPAFHELYARNGQTVDFAPEWVVCAKRRRKKSKKKSEYVEEGMVKER